MRPAKDPKRRKAWEDLTREVIEEAVVRLVTQNGFRGFTMDQVAEEAGVAKGTLYLHFKSKDALLESVKERRFEPLRKELSALLDSEKSPRQKLVAFVMRQFKYFEENRDLIRFLLEERRVAQLHKKRERDSRYWEMVAKVSSVIEAGMKAGEFRSLEAKKVAAMLIEANIAVVAQRLWRHRPAPWKEDAEILIGVFLRGIDATRVREEGKE